MHLSAFECSKHLLECKRSEGFRFAHFMPIGMQIVTLKGPLWRDNLGVQNLTFFLKLKGFDAAGSFDEE